MSEFICERCSSEGMVSFTCDNCHRQVCGGCIVFIDHRQLCRDCDNTQKGVLIDEPEPVSA